MRLLSLDHEHYVATLTNNSEAADYLLDVGGARHGSKRAAAFAREARRTERGGERGRTVPHGERCLQRDGEALGDRTRVAFVNARMDARLDCGGGVDDARVAAGPNFSEHRLERARFLGDGA